MTPNAGAPVSNPGPLCAKGAAMTNSHDLTVLIAPPHHRAEVVFAVASFLVAVALATQWSTQTTWVEGQPWSRQPGLWPLVAIVGMLMFGAGELVACLVRNFGRGGADTLAEVLHWLAATEYLVWYMAYVLAVPRLGYLPATVTFATLLALRLGYRGRLLLWAPVSGALVVVLFKTVLQVRIPGGALYEVFPQAIRNALVIYL